MRSESSRDILLSVKPQYANLLVDGVKTVELRRRFPLDMTVGARCLIYSTSPTQKVIGECKILSVQRMPLSQLWKSTSQQAMIPWGDFSNYFDGVGYGYAITMYGHIRYVKEKSISEVTGQDSRAPQSYRYVPTKDHFQLV